MNTVEIEVLLHFHLVGAIPHPRARSDEVQAAMDMLRHKDLIQPYSVSITADKSGNTYTVTPKGRVYLSLLHDVHVPILKEVWVDKDGKILKMSVEESNPAGKVSWQDKSEATNQLNERPFPYSWRKEP